MAFALDAFIPNVAGRDHECGEHSERGDDGQDAPRKAARFVIERQAEENAEEQARDVRRVGHGQQLEVGQQHGKDKPEEQELDRALIADLGQIAMPAAAKRGSQQPIDRSREADNHDQGAVVGRHEKLGQHRQIAQEDDQSQEAKRAKTHLQGRAKERNTITLNAVQGCRG